MIGILILGQREFAEGLIHAVEHTFGTRPPAMDAVGIAYNESPEKIATLIRARLARLDRGDGVLILADIYGTTHTNVACRLLDPGRVELVSGANLPMVMRALTYRNHTMRDLIDCALAGGSRGIICAANAKRENKPKRKSRR